MQTGLLTLIAAPNKDLEKVEDSTAVPTKAAGRRQRKHQRWTLNGDSADFRVERLKLYRWTTLSCNPRAMRSSDERTLPAQRKILTSHLILIAMSNKLAL